MVERWLRAARLISFTVKKNRNSQRFRAKLKAKSRLDIKQANSVRWQFSLTYG